MNPVENADCGPFLSVIVSSQNGGCEVGASLLRERAFKWDDAHIQAQLRLAPGQLSAGGDASSSSSSAAERSASACRREEWDIDVYQFTDSVTLSNLESLLVRTAPVRVFYCSSAPKPILKQLEQLFVTLGLDQTAAVPCPVSMFGAESLEADLARLTGNAAPSQEIRDMTGKRKLSGRSLAGLVRKRSLMQDQRKHGRYHVSTKYLAQFVRLDAAAANALNLFPEARAPKNSSLYGVLNHCQTRMGSALLKQWVRQPLLDLATIQRRHDLVEIFHGEQELRENLKQDCLRGVPDVHRIVQRLKRGRATLKELWDLRLLAQRLPSIVMTLRAYQGAKREDLKTNFLGRLEGLLKEFALYESFTAQAIDLAAAGCGVLRINPGLSPELQQLKRQMDSVEEEIDTYLTCDLPRQLPAKVPAKVLRTDKPGKHDDGWSLRVNKGFEKHIPGVPGYVEIKTVKAGIVFTTKKLRGLNDTLSELNDDYAATASRFLQQAVQCAVTYLPVIELSAIVISELDVYVSLAHVAATAPGGDYVRPTMHALGSGGNIKLVSARHPCMECMDEVDFIPNNYTLSREDSRFVIVTGPNMGGKSTYIRQLGVIAVMAQIGSFVPAEAAELPVVDSVLARVGAGDAQLKGISTFMAEMLEAGSIIESATPDSLILVDELGRGTSTYDGFGLAWAIGEQIVGKQALCMFATHFHELTALADEMTGVTNIHATAITSETSITMRYEMQPGPCDRSFGIHVAELAHFPKSVVEAARIKAKELENLGGPGIGSAAADQTSKQIRKSLSTDEDTCLTSFLNDFAEGGSEKMTQEEMVAHLNTTVAKLKASEVGMALANRLAPSP